MAWIETISQDCTEGRIGKIYGAARQRSGRVYGIIRLMSLEPATLEASLALYAAVTTSPRSELPRWFRELVAVKVSAANDCFY